VLNLHAVFKDRLNYITNLIQVERNLNLRPARDFRAVHIGFVGGGGELALRELRDLICYNAAILGL
jgi:hypothetical protein